MFISGDSYSTVSWAPTTAPVPTPANPIGAEWPGVTSVGVFEPNWMGSNVSNLLAFVYTTPGNNLTGFTTQIQVEFTPTAGQKPASSPRTADNSVFVSWIGINDLHDGEDTNTAINLTMQQQQNLYNLGAHNFLIDMAPWDRSLMGNPTIAMRFRCAKSDKAIPGAQIAGLDVKSNMPTHPRFTIINNPTFYNVTDPNTVGGVWQDDLHLTSFIHFTFANDLAGWLLSLPAGPSASPGASSVAAVVGSSRSLLSLSTPGMSPTMYPAASAVYHAPSSMLSSSDDQQVANIVGTKLFVPCCPTLPGYTELLDKVPTEFKISTCSTLQNKSILPTPDFVKHDKSGLFALPYVMDLYVGELKGEQHGDEYVILARAVIPGHFLVVTKGANLSPKKHSKNLASASPTLSSLLDEALQVVHLRTSPERSKAAASTGRAVAPTYNVLLTRAQTPLPPTKEQTVEKLHPVHSETTTGEADAAYTPSDLASMRSVSRDAVGAVPAGFPVSGNGLWYDEVGENWSRQHFAIGNGYLGAVANGDPKSDRIYVNIESLWSGGPFEDPAYSGSNHPPSQADYLATQLAGIREAIFNSDRGTVGDVAPLTYPAGAYGSYASPGSFKLERTMSGEFSNYSRWLDMDVAVQRTTWSEPSSNFDRSYFCSNPSRACTVHTIATTPGAFSANFSFEGEGDVPVPTTTCLDNATLQVRGHIAQSGMLYEFLAKVQQSGPANSTAGCTSDDKTGKAQLFTKGSTEAWISWVGGTEYSMETGNAASGYTFKGADPHAQLLDLIVKASSQSASTALAVHIADYRTALGGFSLDIGQKTNTEKTIAQIQRDYNEGVGDPYLEWLLFNLGRYMLVASTRSHLPVNLQGKWCKGPHPRWSSDYPYILDANINLQMNYWIAEMTNLKVTSSLWDYMEKTWAPRGAQTAKTLYNVTRGWVVHNEMNIFGHTGMKDGWHNAEWANYPEAAAWMMIHVYDHFDYTNDVAWWKAQGWPLLKGVASFWLDHLVEDLHFKDGTLVTAPCNSPEQAVITLACAHSQQLIFQLFEAIEKGFDASGDDDKAFLAEVQAKKLKLDKGVKIGSFGQLQEWKVEFDSRDNRHRHLSHLVGLYPGYVLANFKPPTGQSQNPSQLTREQVLKATEVALESRGDGTAGDADAGWAKIWRAACWAQLQNPTKFYRQLAHAIRTNYAATLWSVYEPYESYPTFQIDANLGYPAALLNALIQAPDTSCLSDTLTISVLPALPAAWANGSITGAKIRGGMTLDLTWAGGKPVSGSIQVDAVVRYARKVEVLYSGKIVATFSATAGLKQALAF
ncbi:hypothetical protein FRC06_006651 [Ceratobasidium sp. 370]|nr:hypothetical protein FRC06_006651 [Ceratobasidium sp. 370]